MTNDPSQCVVGGFIIITVTLLLRTETTTTNTKIHQFIFNHYKKNTQNNPASLAIFEKKLRSIANTIKDNYIKKYVLEYFIEKHCK